jgi:hypothetical protein
MRQLQRLILILVLILASLSCIPGMGSKRANDSNRAVDFPSESIDTWVYAFHDSTSSDIDTITVQRGLSRSGDATAVETAYMCDSPKLHLTIRQVTDGNQVRFYSRTEFPCLNFGSRFVSAIAGLVLA